MRTFMFINILIIEFLDIETFNNYCKIHNISNDAYFGRRFNGSGYYYEDTELIGPELNSKKTLKKISNNFINEFLEFIKQ